MSNLLKISDVRHIFIFFCVASLVCIFTSCSKKKDRDVTLKVHCAAGLRQLIEPLADAYFANSGVTLSLNFGGSGELLAKLPIVGGDLYIPADSSYIDLAKSQSRANLIASSEGFFQLTPVLMVANKVKSEIPSLEALTSSNFKIILGDKSTAIGKTSFRLLEQKGLTSMLEKSNYSTQPTVSMIAAQVAIGAGDVGIVWDVLEHQYPTYRFIHLPSLESESTMASIAVLNSSDKKSEATKFLDFIKTNPQARQVFKRYQKR